jgi:hypothetical protein
VQLTDVNVTKSGQALAELVDLGLVGLDLLALRVLAAALLFGVEAQVLEENDTTVLGVVDGLLNLGADTVVGEGDLLADELLELSDNGLQRVLFGDLAIGTAKVGHEDNGLGAILDSVLDGRDGTGDTLVVGDVLVTIERDVEVDLYTVSKGDEW